MKLFIIDPEPTFDVLEVATQFMNSDLSF